MEVVLTQGQCDLGAFGNHTSIRPGWPLSAHPTSFFPSRAPYLALSRLFGYGTRADRADWLHCRRWSGIRWLGGWILRSLVQLSDPLNSDRQLLKKAAGTLESRLDDVCRGSGIG